VQDPDCPCFIRQIPIDSPFGLALQCGCDPELEFQAALYHHHTMNKNSTPSQSAAKLTRLLAEISRVILSTLDHDSLYRITADSLRFALGYVHVALFEVDSLRQVIALRAQSGASATPFPQDYLVDINQGTLGMVVHSRQPRIFMVDAHNQNTALLRAIATEITLPIFSGPEVIGLLFLAAPSGVVPTQQDMAALERLTEHLGLAIENARAHSALRAHDYALSTLLRANKDLFDLKDRDVILRRLASYLFEALPDSQVAIVELTHLAAEGEDQAREMARVRRFFSPETLKRNESEEELLPVDDLDELSDARRTRRVTEVSLHSSRVLPRKVAEEIHAAESSPYLIAPLVPQDQVLAFLVVHRLGLNSGFAAHEIDLAEALSNLVSLWLRNAMLIEELNEVNQELAKSNELKTNLMSILSHDVKSPLHGIHGFAELLQSAAPNDPELNQATQVIMGNVRRIVAIIDDTMSVSRIEGGEITLKTGPLSLEGLIDEQIESHTHHFRVEKQVAPSLPPVMGDRLRVMEILENLISNAIKYSRDGNQVTVMARLSDDRTMAQVTVLDRGMGIPEDELPRLFSRYYRIRNDQTRAIEGTGLGLYIVKLLVTAHGGSVWVESKYGEGSQFHFTLPIADPSG
jgi:signal transduction histidine kinase